MFGNVDKASGLGIDNQKQAYRHVATTTRKAVYLVMKRLNGVITIWIVARAEPCLVAEIAVGMIVGKQIVKTATVCGCAIVKLLSDEIVL